MTKRSRIICLILAAIFTMFLEILTFDLMNYKSITIFLSIFLYFANCIFLVIDVWYTFKNSFSKYHFFCTIKNIALLVMLLKIFYIIGNLTTIQGKQLLIVITLIIIVCSVAIISSKIAQKYCEYTYKE